jgi:hypothetical protein
VIVDGNFVREQLTCTRCNQPFYRPNPRGRLPQLCLDCRPTGRPKSLPEVADYDMVQRLTALSSACRTAAHALRVGRPAEALAVLEAVA